MTEDGNHYHEVHVPTDLPRYHPQWTNLALDWTYRGYWLEIPRTRDFRGSTPKNWKIARKESYIDEEGEVRDAISYGLDERNMIVWYDLEEVKNALPN